MRLFFDLINAAYNSNNGTTVIPGPVIMGNGTGIIAPRQATITSTN
jgi:hypothetical protein